MSRANKRDTDIRSALEGIAGEVAFIQDLAPLTRLRVKQGRDQSGLVGLLDPALVELDDVAKSVCEIDRQVRAALAALKE